MRKATNLDKETLKPKKPVSNKKTRIRTKVDDGNQIGISSENREQMIAKAAYFKALNRNFEGDDCLNDWLTAEKEINTSLIK